MSVIGITIKMAEGTPVFTPYSRFEIGKFIVEDIVDEKLTGRAVTFAGVTSSILGATKIRVVEMGKRDDSDVVFVNSFATWSNYAYFSTVYAPFTFEEVSRSFPGWSQGSGVVGGYKEFYRIKEEKKEVSFVSPFLQVGSTKHPPVSLFPFIVSDVFLKSQTRVIWDTHDFSSAIELHPVMKGPIMHLLKGKSDWRNAILVKSGLWMYSSGEFRGSNMFRGLSPDMSLDELRKLHWWDDIFDAWIKSNRMYTSLPRVPFAGDWDEVEDGNRVYYCFKHKLPRSAMLVKIDLDTSSSWDTRPWSLLDLDPFIPKGCISLGIECLKNGGYASVKAPKKKKDVRTPHSRKIHNQILTDPIVVKVKKKKGAKRQ